MIESITDLLATLGSIPRPFWAMAGGTVLSWGLTQRLKTAVPQRWHPRIRDLAIRTVSFTFGVLGTVGLWAISGRSDVAASITAGLLVGLWSPAAWDIFMVFVHWRSPRMAFRMTRYGKRLPKRAFPPRIDP